jgi:hypothetical protein
MTSTEVAFDTSCKIEHASRKRYDRLENAQQQVLMSVQLGGGASVVFEICENACLNLYGMTSSPAKTHIYRQPSGCF